MQAVVFGRYYDTKSLIHKIDSRVKLMAMLVYACSLFITENIYWLLGSGVLLAVLICISRISFRNMARGLKGILVLLSFSAICNLFFTQGEIIWKFGVLSVTKEGIETAVFVFVRLVLLLFASMLLTLTTSTGELTSGLEQGLSWLTKIKVPVHDIAMMITIALRFIPIFMEEADKIVKAQKARGADFYHKNWIKRGMVYMPVLFPLFAAAMRRGTELATAMDARCYGVGMKRTKLNPLRYSKKDYVGYALIVGYCVIFCIVKWKFL